VAWIIPEAEGSFTQIDADGSDVHAMILLIINLPSRYPTRPRTISLIAFTQAIGADQDLCQEIGSREAGDTST
jgi:hypothetical protein